MASHTLQICGAWGVSTPLYADSLSFPWLSTVWHTMPLLAPANFLLCRRFVVSVRSPAAGLRFLNLVLAWLGSGRQRAVKCSMLRTYSTISELRSSATSPRPLTYSRVQGGESRVRDEHGGGHCSTFRYRSNARTPCLESKLNFSLAIRNLGADHEATTCVQRRFSTLPQCRLCQHTAFAIDSYSAQSVLVLICRPILLRKRKLSLILPGSCDLDQHQRWFQKDSSMALMSNFVEHL